MGREATASPLHRCEIRCTTRAAGASLRAKEEERGTQAKRERKEERKRHDAVENARFYYARRPFLFGGFPLSFLVQGAIRVKEERRGPEESPKMGTTSRARVSTRTSAVEKDPLLRPHYIVYLSSKPPPFLALLLLPPPPPSSLSPFFLHCSLALRLLVSRNKQLPFSL